MALEHTRNDRSHLLKGKLRFVEVARVDQWIHHGEDSLNGRKVVWQFGISLQAARTLVV